ncbi:acetyl-coenzyme A synthetase N-terminal domain-containing protein [Candidatus Coxiella mudrowiae]|uniref:acetyl-coenzyme A synthetase N-terminal domain-containing protein n=1 Tax=Candidatus Coxiella mudrowiae TaxID=2054173 RepID=UPI000C2855AB|nr:acetyl-coenzyme A synthetase N-terminal domain-containing protein [Candidatus Coxiella mudrowiae]
MSQIFHDYFHSSTVPISFDEYQTLYQKLIQDPEIFWAEQAEKYISWTWRWDQVLTGDFSQIMFVRFRKHY